MELLSNKSPLLGLITTFPLCADALKRMQKHTGIEESIYMPTSALVSL